MSNKEKPALFNPDVKLKYASPEDRGERNELRAKELIESLFEQIKEKNPGVILVARCMRSPKHHSEDTRDQKGEDIRVRMETRFLDGHIENGIGVYDIKSSEYRKKLREEDQARWEGFVNTRIRGTMKYARFYKVLAIYDERTDEDIKNEILKDLVNSKLLPEDVIF